VKISPVSILHKLNVGMLALLKPLGVWGVCALAIVDSSSIPMPIDAIVIGYVAADRPRFVLYASPEESSSCSSASTANAMRASATASNGRSSSPSWFPR